MFLSSRIPPPRYELLAMTGSPLFTGRRCGGSCGLTWSTCPRKNSHPRLGPFGAALRQVSHSYDPGLFHPYDVPGLPRTNNGRESEFQDLKHRLLSTTGQKGRCGGSCSARERGN